VAEVAEVADKLALFNHQQVAVQVLVGLYFTLSKIN
jgi:hypothetical protein